MRSGWFWGTDEWEAYQRDYYAGKVRQEEYKSSPLANDHDLEEAKTSPDWYMGEYLSRVIDLYGHGWSDLRESYHSLIHKAGSLYRFDDSFCLGIFKQVHRKAFGEVRSDATFEHNQKWADRGHARAVWATSRETGQPVAAALWIIYKGSAYYASAPSTAKNVMHAVVWKSFEILRQMGVRHVEMGQVDGPKGFFKTGFGGEDKPFHIVRRKP